MLANKTLTVRLQSYMVEHIERRVKELGKLHDMDMSKYIRWLIRKDYQQCKQGEHNGEKR